MVRFPELPDDPDLDDLLPEIAATDRPLFIEGVYDDGEYHRDPISREALASAFAEARRAREAE